MTKRYGENGRWICNICECSYSPRIIKELDDKDKIRWTKPKAFHRDLEMFQEPKCPSCNGEMRFSN